MTATGASSLPAWMQGWRGATIFTGIMALSAHCAFPLPGTPVPATMQVFTVLLAGLMLGPTWGAVSAVQYLAIGLLGLPVFAPGPLGAAAIAGATGGYILAFPVAALIAGLARGRSEKAMAASSAAAITVIYAMGCGWLAFTFHPHLNALQAFGAGAGWFLVWDAVKACAAIAVAKFVR